MQRWLCCEVVSNEDNNQLISLSTDNMVKVWDIRNHRCIQTLSYDENESRALTAIAYVSKHKALVTGSTKLKSWPIKRLHDSSDSSNNHPITAALYNASRLLCLTERPSHRPQLQVLSG